MRAQRDPLPHHQRIAILGLGRSGIASAALLHAFQKTLVASDTAGPEKRQQLLERLPEGTSLTLGHNTVQDTEIAIISPGIRPADPIVAEARRLQVPLLAEIELAARAVQEPILAITGTDGKTTTTLLTAHLLGAAGRTVEVGGNIGTPFAELLLSNAPPPEAWVIEVSAFQLWNAPTFSPRVLIATNIAEDHLDYFDGDVDAYVASKCSPLKNMGPDALAVLNADDPRIRTWDALGDFESAWYGLSTPLPSARLRATADERGLLLVDGDTVCRLIDFANFPLLGAHNQLNALAASLAAYAQGASPADIGAGLATFQPPPHRIERIAEARGVRFINDSKATNAHAAMAALKAIDGPIVLIAGGVDKGLALDAWVKAMQSSVQSVVLIGELSNRLDTALADGGSPIERRHAVSMEDAVAQAWEAAQRARASVLLSPGCSSFDMFRSYSHRGEAFTQAVHALIAKT